MIIFMDILCGKKINKNERMKFKVSPAEAKAKLLEESEFPFTVVMKHGSMSVEYYAPEKTDMQTPHKQDELYVIIKGDGFFMRNGERVSCKKGDLLFVPAGMEHRFENFSDDFATWVIFYGPDGGENA
jgi:mannose-6-phosphate isomerase-like protein (cupin superfamily)